MLVEAETFFCLACYELFWAKKGRSHQWSFGSWIRKWWLHFKMSKRSSKRMEVWHAEYLAPSRRTAKAITGRNHNRPAEHTHTHWSRHYNGSVTTRGTVSTLRTLCKLRQNDGKWMVLTYNDVRHTPNCPQIGVLLNNRATKRAAFLLYKFGVKY